jgi:hypothetical protein
MDLGTTKVSELCIEKAHHIAGHEAVLDYSAQFCTSVQRIEQGRVSKLRGPCPLTVPLPGMPQPPVPKVSSSYPFP